jgi:hypothetical protein
VAVLKSANSRRIFIGFLGFSQISFSRLFACE